MVGETNTMKAMAQPSDSFFSSSAPPVSPAGASHGTGTRRGHDLLIAALVLAWLAATAWARPLMLPDEGRYVGVAWEMMRSGDWVTPTLDGLPYFHKPPLFYWITAAAMTLLGTGEWTARAAPLLGAWVGAMALFGFVRRWADRRLANLSLVALLAQPLFFAGAQFANLDMLVAGCVTLTVVLAAHAALRVEHALPWKRPLAGAYAAAAFGVLAKGLIGIVLPMLVIGLWLLARRRWRVLWALSTWWPGPVLFLVLAAPWFVAMQLRFPGFFDYFFVVQHFQRFAAHGFNNMQPFWFYAALLIGFSAPWLPWLAHSPLRRRGGLTDSQRGALRLLMLLWLLSVLLFFSLPASKLVGYILPAVPPLAFLLAEGFALLPAPSPRARRLWAAGCGAGGALGLAAVLWLTIFPAATSRELARTLAAQHRAGEPVIMLHDYVFDLPFYARLAAPVRVVDDWASPDVQRFDNWRKELADAARFDATRAAATLTVPQALAPVLCAAPIAWLVGSARLLEHYAFLKTVQSSGTSGRFTLWRVDANAPAVAKALGCSADRAAAGAAGGL